jgi:carbonic anhydrase
MTCPNATAPVNIENNTALICDLKCEYSFQYPNSSLNVSNRGDYLSLKTDASNTPPVTYNANKYDITEIRLYQPSLHTYRGQGAAAELIILHNGVISQGNLLVCVPIVLGSASTSNPESSTLLDLIISEVANTANSAGSSTSVNIPSFSVNKFVPVTPYFSYTGTLPFSPCNGEYDYVVFSQDNGAFLSITGGAYSSLQQVISANSYSRQPNPGGVFYNKNGPNSGAAGGGGNGDIYMECLPTGSEGESLVPLAKSTEEMFNSSTSINTGPVMQFFANNSWILKILVGLVIMFVLIKGVGYILTLSDSKPSSAQKGGSLFTKNSLKSMKRSK